MCETRSAVVTPRQLGLRFQFEARKVTGDIILMTNKQETCLEGHVLLISMAKCLNVMQTFQRIRQIYVLNRLKLKQFSNSFDATTPCKATKLSHLMPITVYVVGMECPMRFTY